MVSPTAHASLAEMAATPFRKPDLGVAGMTARAHARPFQCNITGWDVPRAVKPTAQALPADVAATEVRVATGSAGGGGGFAAAPPWRPEAAAAAKPPPRSTRTSADPGI